MRSLYLIPTLLFLVVLSLNINAQPSKGGTPPSFSFKAFSSDIDEISVAPIDVAQALQEDANRPGPYWTGRSIPLEASLNNSGTWTNLPDGTKIWRLKISSSGAKALGIVYDDFYIPEGCKLFLYNEAQTQIIGAYTSENNPPQHLFSTELVQGETVTLEYVAPKIIKQKTDKKQLKGTVEGDKIITDSQQPIMEINPIISIIEIVYVYRDVSFLAKYDPNKDTGWGTSDACEVNVNCSPAGDAWQDEKRGVAEVFLKVGASWGWCSGSLVNTTDNSGTPYFLTAYHCYEGATAADLLLWEFYFKYEAPTCTTPGSEPSYVTKTGCTLTASGPYSGGSDFCLVLLEQSMVQSDDPYYNGWDRTNTAWPATCVGIHHPGGDIKKISYSTAALVSSGCLTGMPAGSAWTVNTWGPTGNGTGVTEGGSSGSPLFNSSGRLVGTLSGGSSTCATPTAGDCYGKFYYHWDLSGTANSARLKPWLDPLGTNPNNVNGYDPFAGYPDFYGTPTTLYQGNKVDFTDLTDGATSWDWQFEGGTPSSSTVQNPANIYYYEQGTYNVKLTTVTAIAGTQTMEKIGYITVLPGSQQAQIWCDDFTTPANWTLSTHGGYTDAWVITTAGPTGSYSSPLGTIASTSGGNHALFDSDALGAPGDNQWASVSSNTGVDCSIYESVTLTFQENYRKFYDSTLVYVSTDNFTTSTRYELHADYSNNDWTGNPLNNSLDISSAASGKTNVKVRFTYRSTQDMDPQAGWAYAWQIDDVCLMGTLPGNSLPQPDFTADTRKISPGQSVNFTDQSLYTTSWLWTFDGGTPSSSTLQNPSNIVYNTQGYYSVTLTGTNINGYVTETKTDYIHVFYDCSFDDNFQEGDHLSYAYAPDPYWGYIPGHNGELITAYADKFTIGNLTGKVKSLVVGVGEAYVVGNTTNVTFTIWDNAGGVPGAVLGTRSIAVKDLMPGYLNIVEFTPVSVGSTFFAGFQLN
ncbi:MAG: PKD domain-containing protein, partial [Bacteroidia bacterium]|nr:PKD domain-containing protein [Bacteroidia bacterium]